mmetsp:Transcript_32854/g.48116  ORF Transcript_32854/g.48116 Transcript_32854/m.48116 type:complete len:81 (+) Transcript_32854:326-568(+)
MQRQSDSHADIMTRFFAAGSEAPCPQPSPSEAGGGGILTESVCHCEIPGKNRPHPCGVLRPPAHPPCGQSLPFRATFPYI